MSQILSLIEARGGPTRFAAELGDIAGRPLSQQHVSYWAKQGHVPAGWVQPLLTLLRRIGPDPSPDELMGYLPRKPIKQMGSGPAPTQQNSL
jgi:hypothetical protein